MTVVTHDALAQALRVTRCAICRTEGNADERHLLPLPLRLRRRALPGLQTSRPGREQLALPLGDLCLTARAPA